MASFSPLCLLFMSLTLLMIVQIGSTTAKVEFPSPTNTIAKTLTNKSGITPGNEKRSRFLGLGDGFAVGFAKFGVGHGLPGYHHHYGFHGFGHHHHHQGFGGYGHGHDPYFYRPHSPFYHGGGFVGGSYGYHHHHHHQGFHNHIGVGPLGFHPGLSGLGVGGFNFH